MKLHNTILATLMLSVLLPVGVQHAAALSCLPIDAYLKDVVGNEEVVIFEATSLDRLEEDAYTREVLTVTSAQRGWVEETVLVYHEKHPDWGYLCNNGPEKKGSQGLYVATRNEQGQYFVTQRLSLTDPLVKALKADINEAEIEGGVSELSREDRMNQIITSVKDLLQQITTLFAEYAYWKGR